MNGKICRVLFGIKLESDVVESIMNIQLGCVKVSDSNQNSDKYCTKLTLGRSTNLPKL